MKSLAALCLIGVFVASGCPEHDEPRPAAGGTRAPTTASSTAVATVPTPKPAAAAPSPLPGKLLMLAGLSKDGRRALLFDIRDRPSYQHYLVVDVDSGTLRETIDLPALSSLPSETIADDESVTRNPDDALAKPAIAQELARMAALLPSFDIVQPRRMAAAPDGEWIAFNAGDQIFLADGKGRGLRRVDARASYRPFFHGDRLFFDRINGSLDGVVSRYDMFAIVPAQPASPATKIDGTTAARDIRRLRGSTLIAFASHPPQVKTCVVAIDLTPPFASKPIFCAEDHEELRDGALSPNGLFALLDTQWHTGEDDPRVTTRGPDGKVRLGKKLAWRTRLVSLAEGKVLFDATELLGSAVAVSDEGMAVLTSYKKVELIDASGKRRSFAPDVRVTPSGIFRNASELVYIDHDKRLRVLDTKAP
jgi:hypothetical protein